MENIEEQIDLWHKKKAIREKHFAEMKEKQILKYNNTMNTVKTVKDEANDCKEIISNNLDRLATHNHTIYNLCIDNSENIKGLPIPHNYHKHAIVMFSEVVHFINKFQKVYNNFDNSIKKRYVNSVDLIDEIIFYTQHIKSELFKIKSLLIEVDTLLRNINILQYMVDNDEDMEF
ncbi:uncharacterized protein LOC143346623 [Colletes latitarsis]|uniref:uncharacterized protein LOC143346623 n=1 Tax=Colletes latitarsis TaxID=2605962 RepID=UPI004036F8A1